MFKCNFTVCDGETLFAGTYCDGCCDAIITALELEQKAKAVLATIEPRFEDVPVQLMLDIFGKAPWDTV